VCHDTRVRTRPSKEEEGDGKEGDCEINENQMRDKNKKAETREINEPSEDTLFQEAKQSG